MSLSNATILPPHTFAEYTYPEEFVIPMTLFMGVVMAFAFVGNGMTLLTIWRHRGMRTRTNMFVANLAVADVLVAVFDIPASMVTLVKGTWIFGVAGCYFNGFTVGVGLMLSVHTLMWISVHKSLSITQPFRQTMTRRRVLIMIALAWAWTIFYNLSPFIIGWTRIEYKMGSTQCGPVVPKSLPQKLHSLINTVFNMLGPFLVMTVCYVRIFFAVRIHMKNMRERTNNPDFKKSFEQQKRIAVTLFIVLTCFLVCWTPYLVYSCTLAIGKHDLNPIYNPIAYWCGYFNSACNPFIYAWRSSSFRQGYLEIMCGRRVQGTIGGESWTAGDDHKLLKRLSIFFSPTRKGSMFPAAVHHNYQDCQSPSPSMLQRSLSFFRSSSHGSGDTSSSPEVIARFTKPTKGSPGVASIIQIRKRGKKGNRADIQEIEKKKISTIAEASCEDDECCREEHASDDDMLEPTDNENRSTHSSSSSDEEGRHLAGGDVLEKETVKKKRSRSDSERALSRTGKYNGREAQDIEVRIVIHGAPGDLAKSELEIQRLACEALRAVCGSTKNCNSTSSRSINSHKSHNPHRRRSLSDPDSQHLHPGSSSLLRTQSERKLKSSQSSLRRLAKQEKEAAEVHKSSSLTKSNSNSLSVSANCRTSKSDLNGASGSELNVEGGEISPKPIENRLLRNVQKQEKKFIWQPSVERFSGYSQSPTPEVVPSLICAGLGLVTGTGQDEQEPVV